MDSVSAQRSVWRMAVCAPGLNYLPILHWGKHRGSPLSFRSLIRSRSYHLTPHCRFRLAIPAKGISYELLSFGDKSGGAATYIDTSEFNENLDEPFRGVIAVDASSLPTGVQPYKVRLTSHYEASNVSSDIVGHKIIVNAQTSPFGAGWGLAGLKQLHLGSDGSSSLSMATDRHSISGLRLLSFPRLPH